MSALVTTRRPRARFWERRGLAALQDLLLLHFELGLGEDACISQLAELLELLERVGCGFRSRRRSSGLLLVVLLFVLGGPAVRLPTRDAVRDRGRGAGDDGG